MSKPETKITEQPVRPARGPFVTWCRANGHGSLAYGGGWQFWYSEFSGHLGSQSVSTHEAGATAFRKVLADHGLDATFGSRLD